MFNNDHHRLFCAFIGPSSDPLTYPDGIVNISELYDSWTCLHVVCQERTFYKVCATVQMMRGVWPLGAGLQEQAPNHLKLSWLRGVVVSV